MKACPDQWPRADPGIRRTGVSSGRKTRRSRAIGKISMQLAANGSVGSKSGEERLRWHRRMQSPTSHLAHVSSCRMSKLCGVWLVTGKANNAKSSTIGAQPNRAHTDPPAPRLTVGRCQQVHAAERSGAVGQDVELVSNDRNSLGRYDVPAGKTGPESVRSRGGRVSDWHQRPCHPALNRRCLDRSTGQDANIASQRIFDMCLAFVLRHARGSGC